MEGYDAHVELTVIYANTRGTTGIRLLGSSVKGKSFSKLDVDVKETVYEGEYKKYGFQIKYDPNAREFVGYYPGTLSFKDAKGADYVENVSVNFRCSVND